MRISIRKKAEDLNVHSQNKILGGVELLQFCLSFYKVLKNSQPLNFSTNSLKLQEINQENKDNYRVNEQNFMQLKTDYLKVKQYCQDLITFFEYSVNLNVDVLSEYAYQIRKKSNEKIRLNNLIRRLKKLAYFFKGLNISINQLIGRYQQYKEDRQYFKLDKVKEGFNKPTYEQQKDILKEKRNNKQQISYFLQGIFEARQRKPQWHQCLKISKEKIRKYDNEQDPYERIKQLEAELHRYKQEHIERNLNKSNAQLNLLNNQHSLAISKLKDKHSKILQNLQNELDLTISKYQYIIQQKDLKIEEYQKELFLRQSQVLEKQVKDDKIRDAEDVMFIEFKEAVLQDKEAGKSWNLNPYQVETFDFFQKFDNQNLAKLRIQFKEAIHGGKNWEESWVNIIGFTGKQTFGDDILVEGIFENYQIIQHVQSGLQRRGTVYGNTRQQTETFQEEDKIILQKSFNIQDFYGKKQSIDNVNLTPIQDEFGNTKKNLYCLMKFDIYHQKGSQRSAVQRIMDKIILTEICVSGLEKHICNHLIIKCGKETENYMGWHQKLKGWRSMGKNGKDFTFFTQHGNQVFYNFDINKTKQVFFEIHDCESIPHKILGSATLDLKEFEWQRKQLVYLDVSNKENQIGGKLQFTLQMYKEKFKNIIEYTETLVTMQPQKFQFDGNGKSMMNIMNMIIPEENSSNEQDSFVQEEKEKFYCRIKIKDYDFKSTNSPLEQNKVEWKKPADIFIANVNYRTRIDFKIYSLLSQEHQCEAEGFVRTKDLLEEHNQIIVFNKGKSVGSFEFLSKVTIKKSINDSEIIKLCISQFSARTDNQCNKQHNHPVFITINYGERQFRSTTSYQLDGAQWTDQSDKFIVPYQQNEVIDFSIWEDAAILDVVLENEFHQEDQPIFLGNTKIAQDTIDDTLKRQDNFELTFI